MGVKDILTKINEIAKAKGISTPYIVGGLPRDKLLGILTSIEDVDITTGDQSVHELARLVSSYFSRLYPELTYRKMFDGHSQINFGGIKFDFSSNYQSPKVDELLAKAGISKPTSMQREMFSRDFTCNSLLQTLDLKNILDPTTMGISDIKKKILRTPLPPYVTLSDDIKRIPRIVYMAAKLGFEVEPAIMKWVIKHPDEISKVNERYIREKLGKAAKFDVMRAAKVLKEMGLWNRVPLPDSFSRAAL